jgi:dephospho-CoA kinase
MEGKDTDNKKMIAWFILGSPGAGKSILISRIIKEKIFLNYISADIIKRDTKLSYLQVRNMMGDIISQHVKNHKSFITEGTGQHDDLYDLFLDYKKSPLIDLRVTFIDVPLSVALERNKKRTRVLDDKIVTKIYGKSMERRHRWKDFDCHYVNYKDLIVSEELIDFSQIY